MPRHENPYYLVLAAANEVEVARFLANTRKAAETMIEWSKANDEYGWHAEYSIRPLTRSELAYEMQ